LASALRASDDIVVLHKIRGSCTKPNSIANDHSPIDPFHEPNHSKQQKLCKAYGKCYTKYLILSTHHTKNEWRTHHQS